MSYSCNNNQNVFLTDGRTTSRVSQLPGGTSTICLGYGEDNANDDRFAGTARKRSLQKRRKNEEVTGKIGACDVTGWGARNSGKNPTVIRESKANDALVHGHQQNRSTGTSQQSHRNNKRCVKGQVGSNNNFASGSDPNCGNVITGRSSSRVLAPPGGVSSIRLS